MGKFINAIKGFAGPILGAGLGMLTGSWTNKLENERQLEQQKKLQALQEAGQMKMGRFNQRLAMEMWENTNYAAQVKQLQKAGLNTGLMYQMGGPGGTTQTPTGNVSGASASGAAPIGMGIQLGLQASMQKAQIENIQADTKLKETEANKKGGVDTQETLTSISKTNAEIETLKQSLKNEKLKATFQEYQNEIAKIQTNIAKESEWDIIKKISDEQLKMEGEARSAIAKGQIDQATGEQIIKQTQLATTEQQLRISAQKASIKLTEAQIKKVANDINMAKQANMQNWDALSQKDRELIIRRVQGIQEDNTLNDIIRTIFTIK